MKANLGNIFEYVKSKHRKTTEICRVTQKCPNRTKEGKCKVLLEEGKRCTGLAGFYIDFEAGTLKDEQTGEELLFDTDSLVLLPKVARKWSELDKEG